MAGVTMGSKFSQFTKSISKFLRDIKSELKKVIWPSKAQLINNTVTVLLACLVIGAMIWIVDAGLGEVRKWLYNQG